MIEKGKVMENVSMLSSTNNEPSAAKREINDSWLSGHDKAEANSSKHPKATWNFTQGEMG
jgi:hypothetical protein